MSTAVGASYQALHYFRGSSLYDPDGTGVGVQPYGYDTLTPVPYTQYVVFASKITVRFTVAESATKVICTVFPLYASGPTYVDPSDLRTTWKAKQVCLDSVAGINRHNYVTSYCSSRAMHTVSAGPTDAQVAAFNADPSMNWHWIVVTDTSDMQTETDIFMDVKIVYYARLMGGATVNES